MALIVKQDTNGVKSLLQKGELGYDDYAAGGDTGRVYVGKGTENVALANRAEVVAAKSTADTHIARTDNPHATTKAQVGLGNVDNTSDANKPISTATQAALDLKADAADVYTKAETYTQAEVDAGLMLKVDTEDYEAMNLNRADKYLANQNVVNMVYNVDGKLVKVQYNNAVDTDYEALTYNVDGKLGNVAHYVGGVLQGNTVLNYSNGKLVAAPFVGV